ncbi:secreted protein [Diaporthe sp. PMI_573]|nr:secreted protein [Diaporthaceae sp. PMI_573]
MRVLPFILVPVSVLAGILPTISSVTYSGKGCPSGSVSTSLSADKTIVTLGFDKFQAYIGPGTSAADCSKSCNLTLTFKYPPAYSFAVVSSTYHGYAQLDSGVAGKFSSAYFFTSLSGATFSTSTSVLGRGSLESGSVYTKSDTISTPNLVLSPCGILGIGSLALLNIGNTISLSSSNSSAVGLMTNDDATVSTTQQVELKWFSC